MSNVEIDGALSLPQGVDLPRSSSPNTVSGRLLTISKIFGPNAAANPVQYYINPIGVQSLIYSAKELGQ